ncbi:Teichoic acids export ATP-binding protein TagH [Acaryochloris thomasi RCC1774]|uniref:Teichoic acids export ATP-binding protein TagH n=1 Tax=Acaryochloris thomasi RCC1774 TaxID=1764569 RepID=A0A2W1JLF9_9CYAN|nr:ABC transporter ATP-binding protein [Acaryochloris thomasi]PZD74159.1 Teichoic acids export ATP-binding protein TagH [Acaryochloris thomasi RCC1774]
MTTDLRAGSVVESRKEEVIIRAQNISKKFCRDLKRSLFYGMQDIASEITGLRGERDELRSKEFWALKDVSFELKRGEALGLVGKNGSGKSTLLRIIAGLIKPDTGTIEVNGCVAPLIALGAGFNPILTGRENIYANMSVLGLSRTEIDDRFDEVVEFAEIGDAIDAPVQSYSSGMAARLGFASAIHTEPDIILIDEVLAVGDVKFKTKCYGKLQQLRENQTSFIMVSHSSHSIATVCESALYLRAGKKVTGGDTLSVLNTYEDDLFLGKVENTLGFMQLIEKDAAESMGLDITSLFFRDQDGNVINSPISGELCYLAIECLVRKPLEQVSVNLGIRELSGESRLLVYINSWDDDFYLDMAAGKHEIRVKIPCFGLGLGLYDLRIAIRQDKLSLLDKVESFKFAAKKALSQSSVSLFYQPHSWQVISQQSQ